MCTKMCIYELGDFPLKYLVPIVKRGMLLLIKKNLHMYVRILENIAWKFQSVWIWTINIKLQFPTQL